MGRLDQSAGAGEDAAGGELRDAEVAGAVLLQHPVLHRYRHALHELRSAPHPRPGRRRSRTRKISRYSRNISIILDDVFFFFMV